MRKKRFCFLFFIFLVTLVFVETSLALDPSLVAWWKLDETAGTIAFDSSDNGIDGTLQGNPQWVEGMIKGALDFDGDGDYVDCGNDAILNFDDEITVSAWVYIRSITTAWMSAVAKGENAWRLSVNGTSQTIHFGITYWSNANYATNGTIDVPFNEWHHLTGTFDGTDIKLYIDGVLDSTTAGTSGMGISSTNLLIGENPEATGRYWDGLIDEVGVFNRAFTIAEIQSLMKGLENPALSSEPYPSDMEDDVSRDVVLSWTPGQYAQTHDVYLGKDFDDVNEADSGSPLLVGPGVSQSTFSPGRLDFDQTYFWRVDEVNAPSDNTVFKGKVWSFTVEPIAYPVPAANITPTASGQSAGQGP
jgi:hypothetical protein